MKRSKVGNWLVGLLVSGGLATLWFVVTGMVSSWMLMRHYVALQLDQQSEEHRGLVVLESGEAAIQITPPIDLTTPAIGDGTKATFETLDGKPLTDLTKPAFAKSMHLGAGDARDFRVVWMTRNLSQMPFVVIPDLRNVSVELRLGRIYGGANEWYYVKPGGPHETAYLAGYARDLNQPKSIGYLTPNGWSEQKPSRDAGFRTIAGDPLRQGKLIGLNDWNDTFNDVYHVSSWSDRAKRMRVTFWLWEADRQRLFEVELSAKGSAKLARDFGEDRPLSVYMVQGTETLEVDLDQPKTTTPPSGVFRFKDRIEFVDADCKTTRTVTIPIDLRERGFSAYETQAGVVLLTNDPPVLRPGHDVTTTLRWVTDSGEETRRAMWVQQWNNSHNEVPLSLLTIGEALSLMPAAPLWGMLSSPILWHGMQQDESGVYHPVSERFSLIRYLQTLGNYLQSAYGKNGWQCFLVCGLSGLICAVLFAKHARSRGMRGGEFVAWGTLVFVLGPAGLMGYRACRTERGERG